ncbi:hypothetical protein SFC43_09220 [Bacteroides sp. CR5/BHMF/2]|nr:hypothetical protein [Bacteroides sp. CR5/BHMF/2]
MTILSATTLGYNATAFEGCDALESIFVAIDKVEAYKTGWSALADKIKPVPEAESKGLFCHQIFNDMNAFQLKGENPLFVTYKYSK